ncbi:amidase signature enzyme [Hypoxylon rubiginosum]|uniref:Amidase signature enzyme n=1 Tax=Hypoxylon rubiginosum TaxID=110542 RepID=A0ACC0CJU2_9PEZI|nr:amidase signature enzyme [Hypoxylon rubiginosum]
MSVSPLIEWLCGLFRAKRPMASVPIPLLLRLDACEFQEKFTNNEIDSQTLVSSILEHIEHQNDQGLNLHAVISIVPQDKLLERAKLLDEERAAGKVRSQLHGIPIVVKDCIATNPDLGLNTSAGNHAVLRARVIKNAPIIDRLLEKGAIIIGKANLSEFCAFKGEGLIDGFSPVGGQTISPYVYEELNFEEGDLSPSSPGGSSTGSAVSVSAGFALVGIGTETDGSIVQPASRQALYALKPTLGSITAEGCWRVSQTRDIPGVMARSARDIAAVLAVLVDDVVRSRLPPDGYMPFLTKKFDGLRVGFVDPTLFRFPLDFWTPSDEAKEQHDNAYLDTIEIIRKHGAIVKHPVNLPSPTELTLDDEWTPATVNTYEHRAAVNEFLKQYSNQDAGIHTLDDIVRFNLKHSDICLPKEAPDQSWLEKAIGDRPSEEAYQKAVEHMARVGKGGIDKVMKEHQLDVVIGPMDSPMCSLSCASGYPIANVPLGRYHLKGELSRPFGLGVIAGAGQESTLIRFMSAFEAIFPLRPIPERVLQETTGTKA